MSKIFKSRTSLVIAVFGSGYLLGVFAHPPDSGKTTEGPPGDGAQGAIRRSRYLGADRAPDFSRSEDGRIKLAKYWEDADMDAIIGKAESIKTFESNTFDTGISREMCDYLAISRTEKSAIDSAIRATVEQLQELQSSSVEATRIDDNTTKFVIRKFPNEGGTLREGLQKTLVETLGENRYFMFSKIAKYELDFSTLNFGENDIQITMTRSASQGAQQYETMFISDAGSRRFETDGVPPAFSHLIEMK